MVNLAGFVTVRYRNIVHTSVMNPMAMVRPLRNSGGTIILLKQLARAHNRRALSSLLAFAQLVTFIYKIR